MAMKRTHTLLFKHTQFLLSGTADISMPLRYIKMLFCFIPAADEVGVAFSALEWIGHNVIITHRLYEISTLILFAHSDVFISVFLSKWGVYRVGLTEFHQTFLESYGWRLCRKYLWFCLHSCESTPKHNVYLKPVKVHVQHNPSVR